MSDALIGIAGGRGAIGQALARQLRAAGLTRLRIGSRLVPAAPPGANAGHTHLDIDSPESLAQFCAGCRVIVNCAGPAYRIGDRVARAAFHAGAGYVDPGGDEPLFAMLTQDADVGPETRAVLSAGFMPGLTGILPRWLARQDFVRVSALTAHSCIRDRFTHAAAVDYLLSLRNGYGVAQSMWRNGAVVQVPASRERGVALPFFPSEVNSYPFLSREAERVARALQLDEGRWYTVFDGPNMWRTLARVSRVDSGAAETAALAQELIRAAEMDLFGRPPEQTLVFQLTGVGPERAVTRSLLVRAKSTYELSAIFCALAIFALLSAEVPPGVHFAADVLNPQSAADALEASPSVASFELFDSLVEEAQDEGAL
jgi:saccharopine dehydrogenase-like NADP-dependent oxidoreductase